MTVSNRISRREALAAAGVAAYLPSKVLGRNGFTPPTDKLNIAFIGIGNYGERALKELATQNIVAVCDVDWRSASAFPNPNAAPSEVIKRYSQAKRFDDWRVMLDQMDKSIDAVVVS